MWEAIFNLLLQLYCAWYHASNSTGNPSRFLDNFFFFFFGRSSGALKHYVYFCQKWLIISSKDNTKLAHFQSSFSNRSSTLYDSSSGWWDILCCCCWESNIDIIPAKGRKGLPSPTARLSGLPCLYVILNWDRVKKKKRLKNIASVKTPCFQKEKKKWLITALWYKAFLHHSQITLRLLRDT